MKLLKIKSISKSRVDNVYDIHHKIDYKNFFDEHPNLIAEDTVISNCSRHAGGVLFADNLNEHMPLINNGGVIQTPWTEGQTVRHLEPLGFIKFDILGLTTLRILERTIALILKRYYDIADPQFKDIKDYYDKHISPESIDLEDQEVYENIFHKGRFLETFQFTGEGAQKFCIAAKPRSITDLSAITSIYRPGPMSANVDKKYVENKEHPDEVKYLHDIVKEVAGETYGHLVFQEQISLLANRLGKNLTLDEGNELRKVLTKKGTGKEAQVKEKLYGKFIDGCIENGLNKDQGQEIWKLMEYFSGYGFNKCLAGTERVNIKDGDRIISKPIKDAAVGELVETKNGFVKILDKMHQGTKKVVRITTASGKKLVLTLDHKVETEDGMMPLEQALRLKKKILTKA